jgi:pyroglutamyl-peptidase
LNARLLVIGFGPFPGVPDNPSAEIARRVAKSPRWRRLGIEAEALVIPTAYSAIESVLAPALRARRDAVLMIGLAGKAKHIRVERRATNRASVLAPDAAGRRGSRLVLTSGPAHRASRVSAGAVLAGLRRAGLRARLSQDAGRYLCNACYFSALAEPLPVLFLHIPKAPRRKPRRVLRRRARSPWQDRLAAAFVDVGINLAAEARRRGR